jgi:hypothetical protein
MRTSQITNTADLQLRLKMKSFLRQTIKSTMGWQRPSLMIHRRLETGRSVTCEERRWSRASGRLHDRHQRSCPSLTPAGAPIFTPPPLVRKQSIYVKTPYSRDDSPWSSPQSDTAPRLPGRTSHTPLRSHVPRRNASTPGSSLQQPLQGPPRREMPIRKRKNTADSWRVQGLMTQTAPKLPWKGCTDSRVSDSAAHRRVMPMIRLKQVFAPYA